MPVAVTMRVCLVFPFGGISSVDRRQGDRNEVSFGLSAGLIDCSFRIRVDEKQPITGNTPAVDG